MHKHRNKQKKTDDMQMKKKTFKVKSCGKNLEIICQW